MTPVVKMDTSCTLWLNLDGTFTQSFIISHDATLPLVHSFWLVYNNVKEMTPIPHRNSIGIIFVKARDIAFSSIWLPIWDQ